MFWTCQGGVQLLAQPLGHVKVEEMAALPLHQKHPGIAAGASVHCRERHRQWEDRNRGKEMERHRGTVRETQADRGTEGWRSRVMTERHTGKEGGFGCRYAPHLESCRNQTIFCLFVFGIWWKDEAKLKASGKNYFCFISQSAIII